MKRKILLRAATVTLLLASIAAGMFTARMLIASARDADLARRCAQEKQKSVQAIERDKKAFQQKLQDNRRIYHQSVQQSRGNAQKSQAAYQLFLQTVQADYKALLQQVRRDAILAPGCQNNRLSGTVPVMPTLTPAASIPQKSGTAPGPTSVTPTLALPTTTPASSNGEASEEVRLAQQLLRQINSDRAAQGLPALQWDAAIARAAQKHNEQMASGCGMSHQCPGEPGLGTRLTNAGVQWRSCGENVGYATAGSNAWNGILRIHNAMMGERPPDDGHRRNLLSPSFQRIGIDVHIDNKGLVWLTEDFAL